MCGTWCRWRSPLPRRGGETKQVRRRRGRNRAEDGTVNLQETERNHSGFICRGARAPVERSQLAVNYQRLLFGHLSINAASPLLLEETM